MLKNDQLIQIDKIKTHFRIKSASRVRCTEEEKYGRILLTLYLIDVCHLSIQKAAQYMGCSIGSIYSYIREAETKKAIETPMITEFLNEFYK